VAWAKPCALAAGVAAMAALGAVDTLGWATAWLLLHVGLMHFKVATSVRTTRWLMLGSWALMLLVGVASASEMLLWWTVLAPHDTLMPVRVIAAQWPLWLLLAGGLVALQAKGRSAAVLALLATACLAGFAASRWDSRSALVRAVEANLDSPPHPWQSVIAPHATVLWPNGTSATWGLLRRPEYFSPIQGAASVFDRRLALLHQERSKAFAPIHAEMSACMASALVFNHGQEITLCEGSDARFTALCQSEPKLRYFVRIAPLKQAVVADWRPDTAPGTPTYHLHDCQLLRKPSSSVSQP
jgi:hypothetical protein